MFLEDLVADDQSQYNVLNYTDFNTLLPNTFDAGPSNTDDLTQYLFDQYQSGYQFIIKRGLPSFSES